MALLIAGHNKAYEWRLSVREYLTFRFDVEEGLLVLVVLVRLEK